MKSCNGNALVRFLFVPLIGVLIAGACLPAVSELVKQEENTDTVNRFVQSVRFARTQAKEQYRELKLCASADGNRCSRSKDWSTGWILIDTETNSVVKTWMMLPGRLGFTGEAAFIRFDKNGYNMDSIVVLSMFDRGCATNGGSEGRRVSVNMLGKTRVERTECMYLTAGPTT